MDSFTNDIEIISNYLLEELVDNSLSTVEVEFVRAFVCRLKDSLAFPQWKLLVSIGIDLRTYKKYFNGNVDYIKLKKFFCDVILHIRELNITGKTFDTKTLSCEYLFAFSLRDFKHELCTVNMPCDSSDYFRVILFKDYMDYVVKANNQWNPSIPSVIKSTQIRRYYIDFIKEGLYSSLNITQLNSGTGWVFIADRNELQTAIVEKDVSTIMDSLGYYVKNIVVGEPYVSLCYPQDFKESTFQPTTLSGDWGRLASDKLQMGNQFFIPYFGNPSVWGKTHSVTGKLSGAKERTHISFDYQGKHMYSFSIQDLGEDVRSLDECNPKTILSEAIFRFQKA